MIFKIENNKKCLEKYEGVRNEIRNGDLILYRGDSFMAKGIQYFDKAYYNHIGIIWKPEDEERVLTLDMWSQGLTCVPVSKRIGFYKDFCILRPKVSELKTKVAISLSLKQWDGRDIKYDNQLILRVAMIKKLRIDITRLGKKDKFICSGFAQYYCDLLGLKTYSKINLITPEDFRRFMDENFEIIFDESPNVNMSYYEKNSKIKCLFGRNYKLVTK